MTGNRVVGVARVIGSAMDPDKRRLDYLKKLMCQREVSKAFRAITSDAKVLPHSPEGLEFLQSKHPAADPAATNGQPGVTSNSKEVNRY